LILIQRLIQREVLTLQFLPSFQWIVTLQASTMGVFTFTVLLLATWRVKAFNRDQQQQQQQQQQQR